MARTITVALALALSVVAGMWFLFEAGDDGEAPVQATPADDGTSHAERSPTTLQRPELLRPEPADPDRETRSFAQGEGLVGALTFTEDELPDGMRPAGGAGWDYDSNPAILAEGMEVQELEGVFGFRGELDAADIDQVVLAGYRGPTAVLIFGFELRDPRFVPLAARSVGFVFDPDFETIEGDSTLVVVIGEPKNAVFRRMVELVRERIE